MPCGLTTSDREKIAQARKRTRELLDELEVPADNIARANVDKVNDRWEGVATKLKAGKHEDPFERKYTGSHEIMINDRHSLEDIEHVDGVTPIAVAWLWLKEVNEQIWIPTIMQIAGISEEEKDEFYREWTMASI